jgi:DNA-binding transcriptional MerR regulator
METSSKSVSSDSSSSNGTMPDSSPPTSTVDAEATTGHLSIGEVLALLLEEFPDVTISKIRFLESQGLINPERTASGYRKFYADDVDLLRCILREQRENYLPLRVIKDRIDAGEIDPTNENPRPRGIKNVSEPPAVPDPARHPSAGASRQNETNDSSENDLDEASPTGAAALFMRTDQPSSSNGRKDAPALPSDDEVAVAPSTEQSTSTSGQMQPTDTPDVLSGALRTADEVCDLAGLTRDELAGLESYGVVAAESVGGEDMYDEDAVQIAIISKRFLDAGVDARHLRGWRVAAEREAGLLEQLIQPLLRQRNPEARARAVAQLAELEEDGGKLRTAMMHSALRHHTTR